MKGGKEMVEIYDTELPEMEFLSLGQGLGNIALDICAFTIPRIARIGQVVNVTISALEEPYFGLYTFPDKLFIFPYNMLKNIPMHVILENLVFTIVHEMMHSQQIIDTCVYENNVNYHKMIEDSVDIKAIEFIKRNKTELEAIIKTDIDIDRIKRSSIYGDNKIDNYQKMSLFYYYYKLMKDFMYMVEFYDVYSLLSDSDNIILKVIKDNNVQSNRIKENGEFQYYHYDLLAYLYNPYDTFVTMNVSSETIIENNVEWQHITFEIIDSSIPTIVKYD